MNQREFKVIGLGRFDKWNISLIFFLRRVALLPHKAQSPDQVNLEVGEMVGVAGNHWDGFSKGRNLHTNQVGLYPSFKVRHTDTLQVQISIYLYSIKLEQVIGLTHSPTHSLK